MWMFYEKWWWCGMILSETYIVYDNDEVVGILTNISDANRVAKMGYTRTRIERVETLVLDWWWLNDRKFDWKKYEAKIDW